MSRRALAVPALVVLVAVAAFVVWRQPITAHFLQEAGIQSAQSRAYNLWSGFAGELRDLVELPALGALYWWHHNCHAQGCLRIGRHQVEGTPFRACRRHHPAIDHSAPVTGELIARAHKEAADAQMPDL